MPFDAADLFPDEPRQAFALQGYAAIGDGRSVALVANGSVAWWCVPSIDSSPLFDCLLDADNGGFFALAPTDGFRVERRYRPDSNVLETDFITRSGRVRVTESLNSTLAGRLPWCELARRLETTSGTLTTRARLVFGTRGDTVSPWLQPSANGRIFHVGPVLGLLRVSDNVRLIEEEDRSVIAELTLREGERALIAVVAGEDQPLGVPAVDAIEKRIDLSETAWREWAEGLCYEGPYREAVRRSALALKLLWYSPSGAIAAAATTSLPERAGGDKNFDYRYAWVRDAGYALAAFNRLGVIPESQAALAWLIHRLSDTGEKVCFRLDGGPVPAMREYELPGYRGARPVVTGNKAAEQHQHGIYGDIFEAAALFLGAGNALDQGSAILLSRLADACADRWRQKDAGIWELEEPRHYTMSKLSCWQALTRAIELAEAGHLPTTCVPRWTRERDRIASWIDAHCWLDEKRAYTFYPGTDRLDASLVAAARLGFGDCERAASTCDAVRRELGRGPWIYRYSGAETEEGAFLACSFWLVEAYAELGRREEASTLMDKVLAALPANVGILSEMIDPETGDFLGNLPQGLSHLALIHAAVSLAVR